MSLGFCLIAATAQAQEDAEPAPPAPPGATDTALPRTGIDPTVSDLREHLLDAYGDVQPSPPGVSEPNLQLHYELGVSEEYTTNAGASLGSSGGARATGSDFVTEFQPGITVVDTSQRLRVSLDYHPIGQVYAENSGFSQFEQQGNGDVLATALPGWLYVDLRGSISQQSVFGGVGPATTVTLSPDERETESSVSISPYVAHSFGGTGTAQLGVSYAASATDAPNTLAGNAAQNRLLEEQLQAQGTYGSSNLSTDRVFANFTTGEDYGRLRDEVALDASFYSGSGALAGGRRVLATDDASYALTRLVTLLGEAGYENLAYPRSDYRYDGPIGSGGVRLTPRPGSSATLEYRYVDGFGSVYAQASVQVTPRVRVFGGYSEGISTFDLDLQDSLLDSNTLTGVAASALQASPLLSGSNAFGANQNLTRLHRLDASATYISTLDTVTLSVNRQSTDPVGRPLFGIAQVTTTGFFGSASEQHQLSDTLGLNAFVQFGSNRTGLVASGSGDTLSVSVGVTKSFPRDLSAYARVGGTYYLGGNAFAASGLEGQTGDETVFIIGGLKRF